jgi:hypothetical protein
MDENAASRDVDRGRQRDEATSMSKSEGGAGAEAEHTLLTTLLTEMFQTEKSAMEHPRKEAERLGSEPPGIAMLAVSEHAEQAIRDLERLSCDGARNFGKAIGEVFSMVRDAVTDRLMSTEKSYRGTLLGLHHGIDCATLTRAVASECGDSELASFLSVWLQERRPLVYACEDELKWFARHPKRATERAA